MSMQNGAQKKMTTFRLKAGAWLGDIRFAAIYLLFWILAD